MLRLTVISHTHTEALLKVEGWISGEDVEVLRREGTCLLQEAERLVLDLRGVKFIDPEGIALLQGWPRDRVVLRNSSLFVSALLKAHRLDVESSCAPKP